MVNLLNFKEEFTSRYQIQSPLDCGRYGTVYRARSRDTDKLVAVKRLPVYRQDMSRINNINMLTNETANMKRLKGERNVVKLIETLYENDAYYVVMELHDGSKVKEMLHKVNSDDQVRRLVAHMAMALNSCHKYGIVHNDLKPSNIMYDHATKDYKLGDFGSSFRSFTYEANVQGTPWFFSPEKFLGAYGYTADIWALGIMTYVLLHNAYPFVEERKDNLSIEEIRHSQSVNPIMWHELIENDAKDFIKETLKKEYSKRLSSTELLFHPYIRSYVKDVCV